MRQRVKKKGVREAAHLSAMLAAAVALVTAQPVFAITAPAAGSFAFDLYDVAINQVLLGAPGFVGAVIIMVISAVRLTNNWVLSIAGLLGGVILINADAITESMGMLV